MSLPLQPPAFTCTDETPITSGSTFTKVILSWTGSSSGPGGAAGAGSGSWEWDFDSSGTLTPAQGKFTLFQSGCCPPLIIRFGSQPNAGSWSDSEGSCSNTVTPLVLIDEYPTGIQTGTLLLGPALNSFEGCLNSGISNAPLTPSQEIPLAPGTFTYNFSGGRFGGSFSYQWQLVIS